MEDNKLSNITENRLFKNNVLSILLCAAEPWKVTKGICQMLEVCQNKCLRLNAADGDGSATSVECH